jgi:hypothetical protein
MLWFTAVIGGDLKRRKRIAFAKNDAYLGSGYRMHVTIFS